MTAMDRMNTECDAFQYFVMEQTRQNDLLLQLQGCKGAQNPVPQKPIGNKCYKLEVMGIYNQCSVLSTLFNVTGLSQYDFEDAIEKRNDGLWTLTVKCNSVEKYKIVRTQVARILMTFHRQGIICYASW